MNEPKVFNVVVEALLPLDDISRAKVLASVAIFFGIAYKRNYDDRTA